MKKKSPKLLSLLTAFSAYSFALFGCGVKGPPLPPVADTPNASDRADISGPAPAPSPAPSPTPKPKSKRHR